jgi:putative ABC transport system permease protein
MARILKDSTGGRRFSMLLVGLFAATALLLIIAGTYGVVSYSVSQRTHEIGVRMTLGAGKGRVARQFLMQVGGLLGLGLVLGILGAWVGARIIRSMVYGISAVSPLQMGLAAGIMVLAALAATAGPVLRATAVDPLEAMSVD